MIFACKKDLCWFPSFGLGADTQWQSSSATPSPLPLHSLPSTLSSHCHLRVSCLKLFIWSCSRPVPPAASASASASASAIPCPVAQSLQLHRAPELPPSLSAPPSLFQSCLLPRHCRSRLPPRCESIHLCPPALVTGALCVRLLSNGVCLSALLFVRVSVLVACV